MILGGNQPYFFPYLGYFQLINSVDIFLIGDDFQYIKGGWINRNRLIIDNKVSYFTLPLIHPSPNRLITEIDVCPDKDKIIRVVRTNYAHSPLFKTVFPLLEEIIQFPNPNLSYFLYNSLKLICNYIGVTTPLLLNSERHEKTPLKGEDRVIHLCKSMGADTYINAIGGQELYSRERFAAEGIVLKFITPQLPPYKQLRTQKFVPALSILDVMMNVPKEEIRHMLNCYTLV